MSEWGVFPFGKPNTERPKRSAKQRDGAAIVGVYPSAWHVQWTAPTHLPTGPTGRVGALAVDVEPTVFWDDSGDDFAARLARWKADVGFVDGEHGTISASGPSRNGVSGLKLDEHYLRPLGLAADAVTFTDVYPVYMVKSTGRKQREQGDAIRQEYDPIAQAMGFAPCTLPTRIEARQLPARAAQRFGARLVDDLSTAAPSLVITLGLEAWETLLRVPALRARPPVSGFDVLRSGHYGSVGALFINARRVDWLPLVHPGQLGWGSEWEALHAEWAATPKTLR